MEGDGSQGFLFRSHREEKAMGRDSHELRFSEKEGAVLHSGVSSLNLAPYGLHGLPNRASKRRISSPHELLFFRRGICQLLHLRLKTDVANRVVKTIVLPTSRCRSCVPGTVLNLRCQSSHFNSHSNLWDKNFYYVLLQMMKPRPR